MTRFVTIITLSILALAIFSTYVSAAFEETLETLRDNYEDLTTQLRRMESKVNQLESLITNSQLSPKVKSVTQTDHINFAASDAVVRQASTKIPRSCQDLRCMGQNVSGLYSIIGTKFVETVFCDFSKQSTDSGYQIFIGYTDVKFAPIYFYVRYYGDFNVEMAHKPIPFNYEMQNVGGAMNGKTGIFTVPRTGTYYLSATGTALFPYSYQKTRLNFGIAMFRNGNGIGWARSTDLVDAYKTESFSIQMPVDLIKGDQIFLQLDSGHLSAGVFPCDSLFFTGYLLQEEISHLN